MNYRQRQRNQADGRRGALALRALGMCEILWIHAAALGAGFLLWAEQAPGFPIRRLVATINSASLDYAAGSRLLRRVKGRGSEKIITNTGDLTLPHEFKARRTQLVGCHHACEGPSFRGLPLRYPPEAFDYQRSVILSRLRWLSKHRNNHTDQDRKRYAQHSPDCSV